MGVSSLRDAELGTDAPGRAAANGGTAALACAVTVLLAAVLVPTGLATEDDDRAFKRDDLRCRLWTVGPRLADGWLPIRCGDTAFLAEPDDLAAEPADLGLSALPQVAAERTLLAPRLPPLTVVQLAVRPGDGPAAQAARTAVLERLVRKSDLRTVFADPRFADPASPERSGRLSRPPAWVPAESGPAFAARLRGQEGVVVALFDADRDLTAALAGAGVRLIRVDVRG